MVAELVPKSEWNDTDRAYPELLLHEAFAAQVGRSPDSPAVRFGDVMLTYAEFDERVGHVASRLLSLGVERGTLVGVCMYRSPELVVALHAILRAGGAYVPIDPEYPDERVAMMLEDLGGPVVLTQANLTQRLADLGAHVEVPDVSDDGAGQTEARRPASVSPDDLAYVIYTSGSTGRPKGAMISHRAIANRIYWMQERYGLTAADKVLQKTPFSFDVSVWEFFWPLLFGAELVVAEPGGHRDNPYLVRTITERKITVVHFVPSMLQLFLEDPGVSECVSLERVFCSGEALPKALQDQFFARLDAELHNLYGPTEAAVDVSAWACDPESDLAFVPIGKPVANTQLHILDATMQPVPVGTAGDLYIGGVQVGLGYLNRPELTAERFLPDPFRDGGSLYKTGDLARYLPDGNIEFLGRSDFQVKIRGFRVELGEIEAALESYEGVRGAVVVARERPDGDLELLAYVAHPQGDDLATEELRLHLAGQLPEYMVPAVFIPVERFALSPNGKVDRKALPPPVRRRRSLATPYVPPRTELQRLIAERWRRLLDVDRVGVDDRFFDLGGSSLQAARFVNQMQVELATRLPAASLFGAPSVAAFADYLEAEHAAVVGRLTAPRATHPDASAGDAGDDIDPSPEPDSVSPRPTGERPGVSRDAAAAAVAIVGMAGRFPGAGDVDTFWANLCAGVESVQPVSDGELRLGGVDPRDPSLVNAAATLGDLEAFDARFFGMGRREAELTDPQHRILLETVWAALEHAGCDPTRFDGRIGIFGGVAANQYLRRNLLTRPELLERAGHYSVLIASEREYAITRAAFLLGLRGPAVPVITACSTSAVATHLAVQSLRSGESDIAIAGGAHVNLEGRFGYLYQEDGILSPDGHVRAFDAAARGTVMASGVAFVVLKRLDDALADRDTIYALIRGSAVNNDGARRVGFTAPSTEGQENVVEDALAAAGVGAETIGLLESHGTGTSLGDPIEVEALTRAYRHQTDRRGYCAIGSLKSNIGHLDAAAGAASIIKAALALHHEHIPPSINFSAPNPEIDFDSSPFFVNTQPLDWRRSRKPRRAGVSSFGFGGTNAHLVLEEAPASLEDEPAPVRPWILPLSAKTREALDQRTRDLADHLRTQDVAIADVAHTLGVGRAAMPERHAIVADDVSTAIARLRDGGPDVAVTHSGAMDGAEVAFLFTGQGAQYAGMGASLYRGEPAFTKAFDSCARIAATLDGPDLVGLLLGDGLDREAADQRLLQTGAGQPTIFALQYALARLWASWGVEPAVMIGHSVGEIAAACIGGALTLQDGLRLAVERGRLMQDLPSGAMTAVLAPEARVAPLLDERVSLAAVNADEQCVASGPPQAIDELESRLTAAELPFRRLPTDRAFHSPMMEPVLEPLQASVEQLRRGTLNIPVVSTLTGDWATNGELVDAAYWVRHARGAVRFADAIGVLLRERPGIILIEIGPGSVLTSLALRHPDLPPEAMAIATLPQRGEDSDDRLHAYRALASAWAAGATVDWVAVNGGLGRRIPLPTYPFARERHWIERRGGAPPAERLTTPASAVERTTGLGAGATDLQPSPIVLDRIELIAAEVTAIIADLSGLEAAGIERTAAFTDLGFDSLFLTQLNTQLKRRFRVRVTLAQLMQETPSIEKLATHIDRVAPADVFDPPPDPGKAPEAVSAKPGAMPAMPDRRDASDGAYDGPVTDEEVDRLITAQLRIMEHQLELLRSLTCDDRPARSGHEDDRSADTAS